MDPLTLLASAKLAHGAIVSAINLGKDITSTAKDLSALWGSVASLTQAAADPPKGFLNNGSAEARALEIFAAKKEAEQLLHEVENFIIGEWGLSGLDSLRAEITNQKKLDKQLKLEAQDKMDDLLNDLAFYSMLLLMVVGIGTLIFFTFFMFH